MNLFSGLEKLGIKPAEDVKLYEEKPKEEPKAEKKKQVEEKKPVVHSEYEFLLEKSVRCPVCEKVFKTLNVKSGRVRRKESDKDLRPRCVDIDIMKYNVNCCPNCGYTALNSNGYFESILPVHKKAIKEKICATFDPSSVANAFKDDVKEWDYDTSLALHKLSLYNAIVKGAKTSEKAYNCLVLSWLLRGKAETLEGDESKKDELEMVRAEEADFYKEAYEGLMKAMSEESFPIAGMDQTTYEYLIATMSVHYGKYDVASKLLASILQSQVAGAKIKDKARDLKDEIIAAIKSGKK